MREGTFIHEGFRVIAGANYSWVVTNNDERSGIYRQPVAFSNSADLLKWLAGELAQLGPQNNSESEPTRLYREPKKPREWWLDIELDGAVTVYPANQVFKATGEVIHVREVLEDETK